MPVDRYSLAALVMITCASIGTACERAPAPDLPALPSGEVVVEMPLREPSRWTTDAAPESAEWLHVQEQLLLYLLVVA